MPDDDLTTKVAMEMVKQRGGEAYDQGLAPVVSEGGKALQTLGKTINMVLSPMRRLALKVEAGETLFQRELEEKLNQIPEERLIEPDPAIAVPLLEGGIRNDDNPDLRKMFANLLAGAMDKETSGRIHPSFVYTLQQLTADEAKILLFMREKYTDGTRIYPKFLIDATPLRDGPLKGVLFGSKDFMLGVFLASSANSQLNPIYFQNLVRLELATIEKSEDTAERLLDRAETYKLNNDVEELKCLRNMDVNSEGASTMLVMLDQMELKRDFWKIDYIKLTDYGYSFLEACSPWKEYEWPEPTDPQFDKPAEP